MIDSLSFLTENISNILALLGFLFALYQYKQNLDWKQRKLTQLRADWRSINVIFYKSKQLLRELEEEGDVDKVTNARSIYSKLGVLTRSTIRELAEVDLPYSLDKVDMYIACGLISDVWMLENALIPIKELSIDKVDKLKKKLMLPDSSEAVDSESTNV